MPRIALLGLCGVTCLIIATSVGIPQEKTSPKKAKAQRHDAEGFALPEGAVARLGTLRGVDDEPIEFLALSADGKKVATLPHEPNPTLRIREVPSGKLLREIPLDIELWRSAALSPDFQKLAWSYLDNSVSVVELATRKQTVLNKPTKDARGSPVSFSSDGKKVIVTFSHHYLGQATTRKGGSKQWISLFDFEIVEWTLEDGKKRQLWKDEKDGRKYRSVAFAPDGKTLAYVKKKSADHVADFEQEFVLEDAVARKPRLKVALKDGSDSVMEFSPDGKVLALADEDSLQLIDIAQGKVRWTASYKDKIHRPEVQWVSTKKPWPEKIVWLHGGDVGIFFQVGELWTWKTSDGTPAKHYTSQATKPLAVAKDAPVLAFTQDGRSLQFLDTSTGKVLQPVEGHRNPPSVLFRSDGSLISYDERKICLWTGGDWRLRTSFEFHDKGQRYYVGPSQNFFVRTVGTKVETRNLESGKVIKEWTLKSAPDFAFLLPDGKTVAAGYLYQFYQSEEPQYKVPERLFVRLLDVSSGGQKEIALPYQPWEIKASPTKALLALKHRDYLDILDIASGKLRRVMDDKTVDFSLLEFAPNGKKVYLSCTPAESDHWSSEVTLSSVELSSGKITKHGKADQIQEAAFSPDGRFLVYSPVKHESYIIGMYGREYTTPSKEIVVWKTASASVRGRFENKNAWVKSISCAPDSRYLATGLYDSTILIWDLQHQAEDK